MPLGVSSPAQRFRLRGAVLALASMWAAAWTWFALVSGATADLAASPQAIALVAPVFVVLAGLFWSPRGGGTLAVCAGVVGGVVVPHGIAWTLLSGPSILLGLASIWSAEPIERGGVRPTSR